MAVEYPCILCVMPRMHEFLYAKNICMAATIRVFVATLKIPAKYHQDYYS